MPQKSGSVMIANSYPPTPSDCNTCLSLAENSAIVITTYHVPVRYAISYMSNIAGVIRLLASTIQYLAEAEALGGQQAVSTKFYSTSLASDLVLRYWTVIKKKIQRTSTCLGSFFSPSIIVFYELPHNLL
jgi:hypothetical protein